MKKINAALKSSLLLGGACFLAYAACYMGRNILSSMLPQMIQNNIYGRDSLGAMGSAFFITYGLGQLVNGMIGNKISAKYMVFTGLFATGILSISFPLFYSYAFAYILWGVCGFLCSMLWGPLSKLVGENTSPETGRIILTLLTVASIIGTGTTYFLAVVSNCKDSWKLGFFLTGFLLVSISVIWFLANIRMERAGIIGKAVVTAAENTKNAGVLKLLLRNGFIAMTIVAMLNGIIRNAVVFWIPTYITERFSVSPASAAVISSILPFVNFGGTLLSVLLAKKFKNDEKKTLFVLFSFSTLMFLLMYLLNGKGMILNIAALFSASAVMTGGCNMIFSFYVLRFAHTGKISGITGFLDFSAYVSASIVSMLFSSLISNFGWNLIVGIWALTTFAGIVFSRVAMAFRPELQNPASENSDRVAF